MKKINLAIYTAFMLLGHFYSIAQYVSFPKGKAVWRNFEHTSPFDTPPIWYYQDGSDTIINTIAYKRVYKISMRSTLKFDTAYGFAYREEVVKQKIWIMPLGKVEEKLLFDFNLKLGDTFSGWYNEDKPTNGNVFKVVYVIDGVWFDGSSTNPTKRRKFGVEASNLPSGSLIKVELIAGIGFSSGMLNVPIFSVENDIYRTLCYTDEADFLKECYNVPKLYQPLSVNVKQPSATLTLYPNPTNAILQISTSLQIAELIVYKSNGTKVLESISTESLDVSTFTEGLYLLEAWDMEGRRLVKKFEKR